MLTDNDENSRPYFETPARSGCLRLVAELLRIGAEVPYLRAPAGAGKTRFAMQLLGDIKHGYVVVWLNAGTSSDILMALTAELGLEPDELDWPAGAVRAAGEQPLLVVIDDADELDLPGLAQLFELHDAGARLLFLGNGRLSQIQGNWDLEFIDLPAFTEQQSVAFLRDIGQAQGGMLTEQVASGLHRASGGWPGHLLSALAAIPAQPQQPVREATTRRPGITWLPATLLVGLVVLLVVAILLLKDGVEGPSESAPGGQLALPAQDATRAPPQVSAIQPVERGEIAPQTTQAAQTEPQDLPSAGSPAPVAQVGMSPQADRGETQLVREASSVPEPELPVIQVRQPAAGVRDAGATGSAAATAPEALDQPPQPAAPAVEPGPAKVALEQQPLLLADATIDAAIAAVEQLPQAQAAPALAGPAVEAASLPVSGSQVVQAVAATQSEGAAGLAWLRAQAPGRYTLQLVAARDRGSLDLFVKRQQLDGPHAVFARELGGKPWYSLVYGVYPDRDAAVQARAQLPASLDGAGVWPRTFGSIQEQLGE
jgi:DamX protein